MPHECSPLACFACRHIACQSLTHPVSRSRARTETYPKLGQDADRVPSTVLNERSGNDLHGVCDGSERPALNACDRPCLCMKPNADRHLCRPSAGCEGRVEEDVACDGHGVREVAVDLIENVLGRSAEEDGARLGILTLGEEREVLVTDLLDVE